MVLLLNGAVGYCERWSRKRVEIGNANSAAGDAGKVRWLVVC